LNSTTRFFAGRGSAGLQAPYSGMVILAVLLAACWLIDRYFDMPIRRWLGRIIPKKRLLRSL
jgi:peptidoglycan/LPS O-acetylase OafA/YrhL